MANSEMSGAAEITVERGGGAAAVNGHHAAHAGRGDSTGMRVLRRANAFRVREAERWR